MTNTSTTEKLGVSLNRDVAAAARDYAVANGVSLSAWLNDAARRQIRQRHAAEYAAWEASHVDPQDIAALDEATNALLPDTAAGE